VADLESIISNATATAEAGGMSDGAADTGDTGEGSVEAVAPEGAAEVAPEGAAEAPVEGEQPEAEPEEGQTPEEAEASELTAAELAGKMIPVSRHKAVLTRTRNELQQAQQQLAHYTSEDVQNRLQAVEIADTNPELFVDVLLSDERYLPILRAKLGAEPSPTGAAKPAEAAAAAPTGRPEADVLLPDGNVGYSAAAMQRLIDFEKTQQQQHFESMLNDRFRPLDEQAQAQRALADATRRQTQVVQDAEANWPQFKENKQAIRDYLVANKQASLEEAYRKIVIPKIQRSNDDIRKSVLAELNQKPRVAVSGPAPVSATPASGKRSMEQVILDAVDRAEAGV
jgi:hypothetical protein